MTARYNATIQELFDISNEAAKLVEEKLTERLTAWFIARKFCRTEQAARHLAEQILAGNQDALAEE